MIKTEYKAEGPILLSILIASIEEREGQFGVLLADLCQQAQGHPVEILSHIDNRQLSIGRKRGELYNHAAGLFAVSIDDDDDVAGNYVSEICKVIAEHKEQGKSLDCIGFYIDCRDYPSKGKTKLAIVSNSVPRWHEDKEKICRMPYQKNPIRSDLCRAAGFPDLRFGEDYQFSLRLRRQGKIRHEYFIGSTLYFYNTPQFSDMKGRYEPKPKR